MVPPAAVHAYTRSLAGVMARSEPILHYLPVPSLDHEVQRAVLTDQWGTERWLATPPGRPEPVLPPLPADPFAPGSPAERKRTR